MNKLQMSIAEIVASYKGAADQNKQIGILADLNACKKSDIKWVLRDAGVVDRPEDMPEEKPVKKKRPSRRLWDTAVAMELYGQEMGDEEIATMLGINKQAISVWRRENNLPANSQKKATTTNDSVKIEPKTEEKVNDLEKITEKAENSTPKPNDDAHVIADAIPSRKPGMTIDQDFENAVKLMEAEHGLKEANKIIEDQKRSLIATHNKCHQLEEKLRAAEAAAAGNPDLMRVVELAFDLLNKMWERI